MSNNWKKGQDKLVSSEGFFKRQREHVHYQPIGVRAQERQKRAAKMHSGLKPMRFVSLHHHSTFSFLDGFQLPEAHVRRATEINMGAIAMTEHGNIFSHVKLEKAAAELGVKPIFGCEFYAGWTDDERKTQKKNHITVIAKDQRGYRNLLKLVTLSWEQGFYYEPTVDWRWLAQHQKGLIILSGCQGSALFTAMVGGKHVEESDAGYDRGLKVAEWFDRRFDDFYVEVQAFPELEKTRRANPLLARVARAIGRPLVATMDCHYTAPEEAEVQQILHNVRPGEKRSLEDMEREWGYNVPLCPPPTDRAIYRRLRETGLTKSQAVEAIVSTEEIAQACSVALPRLPKVEYPLPRGVESATELWREWLREGWKYRGCDRLPAKERERYKEQLATEMEVIEAKGYENYFLIVADGIKFAKDQQIPVGPARGSAAASLACYLLRITEVNPMLYDNLVFERFIDWSREDMPDVDVDFATYGRPLVRDYLLGKYGEGCVNNVGTFTMYKSRLALDDVARVHKVPKREVEALKGLLIERSSGDLRASATIEDTVDQFDTAYEVVKNNPELQYAMDLEGNAKGFGVHAAGLVISTKPITQLTAVLQREVPAGSGNVIQVVSMDKYDAERQGLEKLDFLALSTMDMIAEALHWLDMSLEDLYAIPLDDEKVIDGFRRSDVVGIFQFDGRATRTVCSLVKPDSFHECVVVNALSRPGPLHNGAVQGYVGAKTGEAEPERIHPALDNITADTQYQIIFQEQILRAVREIGNFDWTHAAYIRRIISKKLGDQEFMRQRDRFLEGAETVQDRLDVPAMDPATANRIWGMLTTAGSYAFNAAHSTSYTTIAYWTQWLKQYHPAVFYAASLSKGTYSNNKDATMTLARDAIKGNGPRKPVEVLPPQLDSDVGWRPEGNAIRGGWEDIPGIGFKTATAIVERRDAGQLESWSDLADIKGIGPKTVDTILSFINSEDPFGIYTLGKRIASVTSEIEAGTLGEGLPKPTHTSVDVMAARADDRLVVLAQPIHRNLRDLFEANRTKGIELDPSTVRRPDLSQWCAITARDEDEQMSVLIDRYKYPKFKEAVWGMDMSKDLILVTGKKGRIKGWESSSGLVFADAIWVIEP